MFMQRAIDLDDSSRKTLPSGDEALLEVGRSFNGQLNKRRFYSSIVNWRLRLATDKKIFLEPRSPLRTSQLIITIVLAGFFAGFYVALKHPGIIAVAVISICALWGIPLVDFIRQQKSGPWMIIDAQAQTVSLPRFQIEFLLSTLKILRTVTVPKSIRNDASTPERQDLDAVIELSEGKFIRISLVGELGTSATDRACKLLNEKYGIEILRRTRKEGQS